MTATLTPLSAADAKARLGIGSAVLVDIREADEFARRHIAGAISQPLSGWEAAHLGIAPDRDVIFTCRSGMRTAGACDRLAARVSGTAFVLSGGGEAWEKAGLALAVHAKTPMGITGQGATVARHPVVRGRWVGLFATALWFLAVGLVGLRGRACGRDPRLATGGPGPAVAEGAGFWGMAALVMVAPWNRRALAA